MEGNALARAEVGVQKFIETLAERKIKGFCGTIDEEGNYYSEVYAGNVSLAESITADYHGRFLIELIQNAYDVHSHDRADGEIEVLLDLQGGEHGILYVANRGAGFSRKNVNALCDMGLSSKPPGESIGNKGLGFRSVLHITDAPLIFSQSSPIREKSQFDGFCFGFAEADDLDRLIKNPLHRSCAERDLPLFHVPRWHDEQSESVRNFSARGFATVIALPLRDVAARQAVLQELQFLGNQTVPLLLFLIRLEKLSVRVVPDYSEGANSTFSLFRYETEVTGREGVSIVDLRNVGRFLIVKKFVPEHKMKEAIGDGVAKKQLHSHWVDWEGNAVALALGHGLVTEHTSLIAIDDTPARPGEESVISRNVPINLPEGWNPNRVFGPLLPSNAALRSRQVYPIVAALDAAPPLSDVSAAFEVGMRISAAPPVANFKPRLQLQFAARVVGPRNPTPRTSTGEGAHAGIWILAPEIDMSQPARSPDAGLSCG